MELTTEQLKVLAEIQRYMRVKGFPPCRRDIQRKLGIGGGTVTDRLRELDQAGYIEVTPGLARGIRLVKGVEV